ncbi:MULTISPECIES: carbohydrate porin [unclassified Synechocystis]|uniref:carbohydrate porin n=1 Tax=unclassified Synechocystis TaxID=2640012 RepID=UPI00040E0528|nr:MULTISPECIES: carbohydrate porin [unclassified Synechocystis]MCT0252516.1 carbohydrate porin [Synechocystis sp. CS-94]
MVSKFVFHNPSDGWRKLISKLICSVAISPSLIFGLQPIVLAESGQNKQSQLLDLIQEDVVNDDKQQQQLELFFDPQSDFKITKDIEGDRLTPITIATGKNWLANNPNYDNLTGTNYRTPTKIVNSNHPKEEAEKSHSQLQTMAGISGNPAASNMLVGTGDLGRWLGLDENSPFRLGGVFMGNVSQQISGGNQPGSTDFNGALILGLGIDLEKAVGWKNAFFEVEGLQYNGQPVNFAAGSVQGYNSVEAGPPLNRTELYQLWLNQTFLDNRLSFRVGKLIPSMNFGYVGRPFVTQTNPQLFTSTTGLIYTPAFVGPAMLGFIPGYYNSAFGLYGSWKSWGGPGDNPATPNGWYAQAGIYDGRGAQGVQTGLVWPNFSGPLFKVAEVGGTWTPYADAPEIGWGSVAVGGWRQSGPLTAPGGAFETQTGGIYGYLVQKLGKFRDSEDQNGIVGFVQGGWNSSNTALIHSSLGFGLTFIAPFGDRPLDSYGFGFSWARLNANPLAGYGFNSYETMVQFYAQYHLVGNLFIQPVLTVLPTPGSVGASGPSVSGTVQLTFPF